MPNQRIAELISVKLPELTHPGDGNGAILLPVSTFRTAGLPPDQADQFARDAGYPSADIPKLVGEALVHLIETDGDSEIISKAELNQLRAAAAIAEPQRHRQVQVHCYCGTPLFRAHIRDFDTDKPKVSGSELIKAMAQLSPECALAHRTS